MPQIHELTALELAAAVRSRALSPVEIAEHYLERIAALAPQAARINKQTLRRLQAGPPFGEAERQAHFRYATSADHREGVTSFLEGRPPVFRGE